MYLCCRKASADAFGRWALLALSAVVATSCAVRPGAHLADVQVGGQATAGGGAQQPQQSRQQALTGEPYDSAAEQDIAKQSLAAWRIAVSHAKKAAAETDSAWQKQRAQDEDEAMGRLKELAARHAQQASTVYMMMGQVEEHFGKRQRAIGYYSQSTARSPLSSMALFKLAENERQLGKLDESARYYRQLLKAQPDFYPAQLGLAQCLVKKDPWQARQLAQAVLDSHPDPHSEKTAQAIVSESKGGNRRP